MKVYVLVNQYMVGIQAGIQALHAVSAMWNIADLRDTKLTEWENEHKTVILLNGGGQTSLKDFLRKIEYTLSTDWGIACEDEGLNHAMTALAFLADPEHPKYNELMILIKDLE